MKKDFSPTVSSNSVKKSNSTLWGTRSILSSTIFSMAMLLVAFYAFQIAPTLNVALFLLFLSPISAFIGIILGFTGLRKDSQKCRAYFGLTINAVIFVLLIIGYAILWNRAY